MEPKQTPRWLHDSCTRASTGGGSACHDYLIDIGIVTPYFERDLAQTLLAALEDMPVVVPTGLRQAGKTTFLQRQSGFEERDFVTFDDYAQLAAAKSDPDRFIAHEGPLTIDEAHTCPEVFLSIKRAVDRKRKPGQFLLSGSADFALLKGITESLAGRSVYFEMHPFSRREIAQKTTDAPFLKAFFESPSLPRRRQFEPIPPEEVLTGGMPTVCLGEARDRSLWFTGYEQTYLERDIRDLGRIEDILAFRNFLRLTVLRTGQILSASQLGRDAKLTAALASRYLSLLATSFILRRLSPYLGNKASRLIKSAKIYFTDSGLACFLAGIDRVESNSIEPLMGPMYETFVAQNLSGLVQARWRGTRLYFWTVQGRYEVDFIIEAGRRCLALEVKSGARWQDKDLAGLKAFLSATPHCQAAILARNGFDAVQLGDKLWALPLSLLLS
jgi:predicted AAA+ superfamily ATPase